MKQNNFCKSINRLFKVTLAASFVFLSSCEKEEEPADNNSGVNNDTTDSFAYVTIGDQQWMSSNLNVAKYSDGTPIPQVSDASEWNTLTTGAWCWYNNDSATYAAIYGRLYNWYAVAGIYNVSSSANPALRKKLAPDGWHIPSHDEFSTLINFLDPSANGGSIYGSTLNNAGGALKATGTIQQLTGRWNAPNANATNSTGFSAIPGGYRNIYGGYLDQGNSTVWWSSSIDGGSTAWERYLQHSDGSAYKNSNDFRFGFAVRLVRD
jgi:uncharacterized protein (TIGR02145 family)